MPGVLRGVNHFPSYSLREKAPTARSQATAVTKVLQKQKGYPPKYLDNLGRCSTHPLGYPLPVGTERGERGRERVGEGVPTTKLFLLLLRQLGKKKRELIWGSKGRAGLDGLGHIWVRLYMMPCAGDMAAVTPSTTDLLLQGRSVPGPMLPETG